MLVNILHDLCSISSLDHHYYRITTQKIAQWVDQSGQSHQGFEILDYGHAPWAIAKNYLSITVNNPRITKATILDMNGMATKNLAIERNNTGISFSFPQSSKYVILE